MNISHHAENDEIIPVLIVGGGLVGLSASLFLSWHGISSLLVERHPGTAIHPRASGWTTRTMEMFRTVGIEEAIHRIEPPVPQDSNVLLVESLMGQEFDCLQEDIASLFSNNDSPARGSAAAQDILEPVLRARAGQLGGDLRFGCELVSFEQDEQGITATIRERTPHTDMAGAQAGPRPNSLRTVRARYMVVADGSQSTIRKQLGIGTHGSGSLFHCISMIFEADLMKIFLERHAIMCFISNDTVSGGAMVPYPGSSVRPDIYRLDVSYDPDEETLADYPEERCLQLIRAAVGIPDLKVALKTVLNYEAVQLVADRWQQGHIFLVGDAARTQPPSGGIGGNTGIAEAYNLAWKLAAVLRGEAGEALLATYDEERRPIADYTSEQMALLSQQRQTAGSAGITVDPQVINTGYRYSAGAFVFEEGYEQLPLAQKQWQGQPGTHALHLMLEREGKQVSTLDLIGPRFVLFVGPDGQRWKEAAQHAKDALHLSLDCYQIGGETGDLVDAENRFCAAYGIAPDGAVIVRPDGFIGWRSRNAQATEQTLIKAFSTLLYR